MSIDLRNYYDQSVPPGLYAEPGMAAAMSTPEEPPPDETPPPDEPPPDEPPVED